MPVFQEERRAKRSQYMVPAPEASTSSLGTEVVATDAGGAAESSTVVKQELPSSSSLKQGELLSAAPVWAADGDGAKLEPNLATAAAAAESAPAPLTGGTSTTEGSNKRPRAADF
jgi:hypothetical protein